MGQGPHGGTVILPSILHSHGQEHKELAVPRGLLGFGIGRLDVHAGQGGGQRESDAIRGAGAEAIHKVTVIEGNNDIVTLTHRGDLVIGAAGTGIGGDLQNAIPGLQLNVGATAAAGYLFLGDQRRALQSGQEIFTVGVHHDAVIFQNDPVVVDVFALDELGEEDHVAHDENDVLSVDINADVVVLLGGIAQKLVKLGDAAVGHDKLELLISVLQSVDIGVGPTDSHLEGVTGDQLQIFSVYVEEKTVEHHALVVDTHSKDALADHISEDLTRNMEALLRDQAGDLGEILGRKSAHGVGGLTRNDGGAVLAVHRQGDVASLHGANRLAELGGVDDGVTGLDHIGLQRDANALFKVVGSQNANTVGTCLNEDAICGGKAIFVGDTAEQGDDSRANSFFFKRNFHNFIKLLIMIVQVTSKASVGCAF